MSTCVTKVGEALICALQDYVKVIKISNTIIFCRYDTYFFSYKLQFIVSLIDKYRN